MLSSPPSERETEAQAGDVPNIPGYRIQRHLGRGGMGTVYLAQQISMDRLVAIKIPPPDLIADPDVRGRFVREAQLSVKVRHECLVQGIDTGEADGVPYFVMEYVPGRSLQEEIRQAPLPEGEAGAIVADLCGALGALHQANIVHRDIKPDNIRLTDEGRPKLVDFGLAVATAAPNRMTSVGMFMGTLDYMAPEQHRSARDVEPRSDVFALGATLYHIVTGRSLFGSGIVDFRQREDEVYRRKAEEKYRPLFTENGPLSRELAAVIERALRYEAARRFASAREMAEALDSVPAVRAWRARPVDTPAQLQPQPKPRRAPWAVAAAFVALVLVGGMALWETTRPSADARMQLAAERLVRGDRLGAPTALAGLAASDPLAPAAAAFRADLEHGTAVVFQSRTRAGDSAMRPMQAASGVRLASGEQFRLGIQTDASCFVYLYALDSAPAGRWIFPDAPTASVPVPQPADKLVWLPSAEPARGWYRLDGQRGVETLFLIAVQDPLPDPDAIGALILARPQIPLDTLERELGRGGTGTARGCFRDGVVRTFALQHE